MPGQAGKNPATGGKQEVKPAAPSTPVVAPVAPPAGNNPAMGWKQGVRQPAPSTPFVAPPAREANVPNAQPNARTPAFQLGKKPDGFENAPRIYAGERYGVSLLPGIRNPRWKEDPETGKMVAQPLARADRDFFPPDPQASDRLAREKAMNAAPTGKTEKTTSVTGADAIPPPVPSPDFEWKELCFETMTMQEQSGPTYPMQNFGVPAFKGVATVKAKKFNAKRSTLSPKAWKYLIPGDTARFALTFVDETGQKARPFLDGVLALAEGLKHGDSDHFSNPARGTQYHHIFTYRAGSVPAVVLEPDRAMFSLTVQFEGKFSRVGFKLWHLRRKGDKLPLGDQNPKTNGLLDYMSSIGIRDAAVMAAHSEKNIGDTYQTMTGDTE